MQILCGIKLAFYNYLLKSLYKFLEYYGISPNFLLEVDVAEYVTECPLFSTVKNKNKMNLMTCSNSSPVWKRAFWLFETI